MEKISIFAKTKQIIMKKHILTNRLMKVEKLTKYAMADKNTLKIRQGFHLMKELRDQLAELSNPSLCFA